MLDFDTSNIFSWSHTLFEEIETFSALKEELETSFKDVLA